MKTVCMLSDHPLMTPKFWRAEAFHRCSGGRPFWKHIKQLIGVTGGPKVEEESARGLRAKRQYRSLIFGNLLQGTVLPVTFVVC